MEIFLDTADIVEIKKGVAYGLVDGVTTNPSLIAKTGKTFEQVVKEIVEVVDGPINLEPVGLTVDEIVKEGRMMAKIHENVVVKVPMLREGMKAVKILSEEGINTNVTLIFSPSQALLSAKAGAAYVSPFIGRLDDISLNGMDLIDQILEIYDNYGFPTKVLVASVRHPMHVVEAARLGADVVTMPFKVLEQMFDHPLTEIGVKKFLEAWEKVPKSESAPGQSWAPVSSIQEAWDKKPKAKPGKGKK